MSGEPHKHLRRLPRVWINTPVFFVTTCTHARAQILASDACAAILREEWMQAEDKHGWRVGRYVLMPDHVHFFCTPTSESVSLSRFVGVWKEWTSKKLVDAFELQPPIWQKSFFDHLLRSDESYAEKWVYMRNNPARAGLVESADDWPYQGWVHFDKPG